MRSKAPLALMEQAVMILVFALAAAVCMRVFVWSDRTSKRSEALDRAVVEVQNAAETVKYEGRRTGGDAASVLAAAAEAAGLEKNAAGALTGFYNGNLEPCGADGAAWVLRAEGQESGVPGLAWARVYMEDISGGDILFEVTVAWQTEVGA